MGILIRIFLALLGMADAWNDCAGYKSVAHMLILQNLAKPEQAATATEVATTATEVAEPATATPAASSPGAVLHEFLSPLSIRARVSDRHLVQALMWLAPFRPSNVYICPIFPLGTP